MEKLITILFDSEENAFKASQAINQLATEGDITISEFYVLGKNEAGDFSIKDARNKEIQYTAAGALTGGIIGILGGPIGVLIGLTAGTLAGGIGDYARQGKSSKFLDKASKAIPAGKTAIVANIHEYWETPLDTTLQPFGVEIKRWHVDEEIDKYVVEQQQVLDEEIKQAQEEIKDAKEGQKEKLNAKLEELKAKKEAFNIEIKQKASIQKKEFSDWFGNLKTKFTNWKENVKEEVADDVEDIREDYEELQFKIKKAFDTLSGTSKHSYNKSIDYVKDKLEELDEKIDELEDKIDEISDENKEKWSEKLDELKEKRKELMVKTKTEIEVQKARFQTWLDEAEDKLEKYSQKK